MLLALSFLTILNLFLAKGEDEESKAVDYLKQFGYIDNDIGEYVDFAVFTDAVKQFQDFAGIDATGTIDEETKQLMESPRCGIQDKSSDYSLQGSKWSKKVLTYRIFKYPASQRLSRQDVDRETRKAFSMWEAASDIRFEETSSSSADIKIRFEKYEHGDGNSFDGPGGVLAHAYYPRFGGDAHFDDSEHWSITPYEGNQLLNTLTHEFGHSLGLKHSKVRGSIMAPFYKGWDTNLKLDQDDKDGIQALYGPPARDRPTNTERPNWFTTTTRSPINFTTKKPNGNDDLCNSKIDAVVRTADGSSFVFVGSLYWKLTSDSVAAGYPRKIYQDWPGLPNDIDAAVTWDSNRITYFFKGDKYWRFTNQSPSQGYPKPISKWLGLPDNLDAAFQWARDGHLYFLKGSKYWRYNTRRNRVESSYGKEMSSVWKGLPIGIDGVFQWQNRRSYFFKSGQYWRLNDRTGAVDRSNPPFPRDAGQWWFGCPKKTLTLPYVENSNSDFLASQHDDAH